MTTITSKRGRTNQRVRDLLAGYETDNTVHSERIEIGSLTGDIEAGIVEKVKTVVGVQNVLTNNEADCKRAIISASMDMKLKELQACYEANKDRFAEYRKPTKKSEFVALFGGNWEEGKRKAKKTAAPKTEKAAPKSINGLTFREVQAMIKKNGWKAEGFKATSWAGIEAIIAANA